MLARPKNTKSRVKSARIPIGAARDRLAQQLGNGATGKDVQNHMKGFGSTKGPVTKKFSKSGKGSLKVT